VGAWLYDPAAIAPHVRLVRLSTRGVMALTRSQEACLLVLAIAGRPMTDEEVRAEVERLELLWMTPAEFARFQFDALPAVRANAQKVLVLN
jgi:hypothetical protein